MVIFYTHSCAFWMDKVFWHTIRASVNMNEYKSVVLKYVFKESSQPSWSWHLHADIYFISSLKNIPVSSNNMSWWKKKYIEIFMEMPSCQPDPEITGYPTTQDHLQLVISLGGIMFIWYFNNWKAFSSD